MAVGSVCVVFAALMIVTMPSNLFKDKSEEPETKPFVTPSSCDSNGKISSSNETIDIR